MVCKITFQLHASLEALVESARRTLFPCGDGDGTRRATQTNIVLPILDSPLEKALAAFTREDAVMEARDFVSTNGTRRIDELLP